MSHVFYKSFMNTWFTKVNPVQQLYEIFFQDCSSVVYFDGLWFSLETWKFAANDPGTRWVTNIDNFVQYRI